MTLGPVFGERVVHFTCGGAGLLGILAEPIAPTEATEASEAESADSTLRWVESAGPGVGPRVGVVVVVGGPQYRVGSHRQFVQLARALAAGGVACLRFDARGMGDSAGRVRLFTALAEDISAAVDALKSAVPTLTHVAVWGLCDGATAALIAVSEGLAVDTLILVNPWVQQSSDGVAGEPAGFWDRHGDSYRYYRARLTSTGFWRGLWRKLWRRGCASIRLAGWRGMSQTSAATFDGGDLAPDPVEVSAQNGAVMPVPDHDFVSRMQAGLAAFQGTTFLVLSGRDLTADAFRARVRRDRRLRRALARTLSDTLRLPDADHTFSDADERQAMERACLRWLCETN